MDFLEFPKAVKEDRGDLTSGRLKLSGTQIIFKNHKTGKIDNLNSNEFKKISWQRMADEYCIRIMMKNGHLYRYGGFKETEKDKLEKFIDANYSLPLEGQDLSIRGWNWGTTSFEGSVLNFNVKSSDKAFEIPLSNVSHTTAAKNEVTLEFHQNDDAPVSLMEMRFHIPTGVEGIDPVQAFMEQILQKANIIRETGECIAVLKELQCLTPRGRYDIKIFPTFIQLHGKTFDYKIPLTSVLRLFQLPHKDSRQVFFVMSLDPPIKQGQTRYHFLILLFNKEEETSVEISLTDSELKGKYDGKLNKIMSGPLFEIVAKIMRVIIQRKITLPDSSFSNKDLPAVTCSYRASNGLMYPLERGFIYLHKPPLHVRFDEIGSINFARSGGSTRSFDFEIETKSGIVHTFSSIDKEEYSKLFDFVSNKGLRVKNVGTEPTDKKKGKVKEDDLFDSDLDDGEPDAYLQRVREEGRIREEVGDSDESDESFNPGQEEDEVAEEFDSDVSSSESGDSDDSGSGGERKRKKPKEKKHKPKKSREDKKPKKKKEKDDGKPKRPQSAYFLWMNESRAAIKKDFPDLSVTEFAKKAGELWKELKDRTKWEEMAAQAKKAYEKEMEEYKASGGGGGASSSGGKKEKKSKSSQSSKKSSSSKGSPVKSSQQQYKSQEYVDSSSGSSSLELSEAEDKKEKAKSKKKAPAEKPTKSTKEVKKEASSSSDDSLSDDEEDKKAKSKPKKKAPAEKSSKPSKKVKKESSSESDVEMGSESEEILSSPTASSASDSD